MHAVVGNPIALMNANNAIGREYMTSLLGAMKAVSGGAPGSLIVSMNRLEAAFESVMNFAEDGLPLATTPPELLQKSVPVEHVESPSPSESELVIEDRTILNQPVVQQQSQYTPQSEPMIKEPLPPVQPEPEPEPVFVSEPAPEPIAVPPPLKETTWTPPMPEQQVSRRETESEATSAIPSLRARLAGIPPVPPVAPTSMAPQIEDTPSVHIPRDNKQRTVISPAPVLTYEEAQVDPELREMVRERVEDASDRYSLYGALVNQGVSELLAAWPIFSSSGVFGTGPAAVDHPLFRTLAPLSMGAIMAGRFENTSPAIIDSIKDYANAWRHEQGISFTQIETFDHYLRRVVQRILKRQNSPGSA